MNFPMNVYRRERRKIGFRKEGPPGIELVFRGIPRNRAEDGPALLVQKPSFNQG
jgi:hypothetical protein